MIDVFRRSYGIFRESLAVLAQDKEILVFPLLSGIAMIFVFIGMIGGGWFLGVFQAILDDSATGEVLGYAVLFVWYFLNWFVGLFFNVAVIHCAKIRLDGGDPTVKDGIDAALSHLGRIATWAAISATVGLIAQIAKEKGNWVLRLFASLGEIAWAIATFFIVPVMIFENRTIAESIRESVRLMKRTWGEALVGSGGIGLFVFLLTLPGLFPIALGILTGSGAAVLSGIVVAVIWWLVVACVSSALGGIYKAALYVYATENRVPEAFSKEYVTNAFHPKGLGR
jgi:hypothetical protein